MDLKQSFYIWLYPDNPMSIMVDIFVVSILLYLFYPIFSHNLIRYMILDWKEIFDIERKPLASSQTYTVFKSGDREENEVDMIHEIRLALLRIQDADVSASVTTDVGYNACEVSYLMYFIYRDGQKIINDRAERIIISNTEISFRMDEGEIIVYKDGSANIKTAFGDIGTNIRELRERMQSPYNFQYLTDRINLV